MTRRRRVLAGIGAGCVGALGGCLDALTDEELEFTAEPAEVAPAVAEETGYSHQRTESIPAEETIEAGDRERDVRIVNYSASYAKSIDLEPAGSIEAALFTAVSTPNFEIAGQSVNPVAELDHEELVQQFDGQFAGVQEVRDVRLVEEGTETVLGSTADLSVFEATIVIDGEEVDALIYVTSTDHEDDIVVGVGAHVDEIQSLQIDEEENIRSLMRGIDHPVELEEGGQ